MDELYKIDLQCFCVQVGDYMCMSEVIYELDLVLILLCIVNMKFFVIMYIYVWFKILMYNFEIIILFCKYL